MGRQPFGLASPAAWLAEAGAQVHVQDLAVSHFDPEPVARADLVAFYVPMHTATRLAEPVLQRVRLINPETHICFYGLYAPMNETHLRSRGADSVLGGEFEGPLVELYLRLAGAPATSSRRHALPSISLERQTFKVPDRSGLPALDEYARLEISPGVTRTVGYTEATRGCKHKCRHCPVVPVYGGRFVIVQPEVVLADVRRQVAAGAEHITFGDPDFFNGPAHAMRIVRAMHDEFPDLSYDVTIKVEHLVNFPDLIGELVGTGCVLLTSAIESFDDAVLDKLDKRHTRRDLDRVLFDLRAAGLPLNATFMPFTPWTTIDGYAAFLRAVADLNLVDNVAPIQYAIRMLIPAGSLLLELPDIADLTGPFDGAALSHPWAHPDPAVDGLHAAVLDVVETGQAVGKTRREIFAEVWHVVHLAVGEPTREPQLLDVPVPATIPFLTEPWFC
jgi:radical SAM superfamily enzyme YgiQ (UPF0313 family)